MTALESPKLSRAQNALATSCQPEIRRLSVVELDDRLEVRGTVSSYYMKSIALETVKSYAVGRIISLKVEVDN